MPRRRKRIPPFRPFPMLTQQQSNAAVRKWKEQGYGVKRVKLIDGSTMVLKTKNKSTTVCHKCRKARRRRRRAKPKRFRL